MGWMFQYGKPADIKAEITRLCTWNTDRGKGEALKVMNYGSTWYVACKSTPTDPTHKISDFEQAEDGSYVFAAVFLTRIDKGEFGYKDMDETMGPNASNCPAGILNLLSPTTSEYALAWRERCRNQRKVQRIAEGTIVRLKTAWEPYGTDFKKINYGRRRGVYLSLKANTPVRLRGHDLIGCEVLA